MTIPGGQSKDSSFFNFTKQEIKEQAAILRKVLVNIQSPVKAAESVTLAIKSSQTLIKAGKFDYFIVLEPLFQTLEIYFRTVQKGMSLTQPHLEVLSLIIGELTQIANLPEDRIESSLRNRHISFERLNSQLKEFIQGFDFILAEKPLPKEETLPTSAPLATAEQNQTEPEQYAEMIQDPAMFDLFCIELETQCTVLNNGLVDLEQRPNDSALFETLMRAVHSIKGAARIMSLNPIVRLAHTMEDCFEASRNNRVEIKVEEIDRLLEGVDLLFRLSKISLNEVNSWMIEQQPVIEAIIQRIVSAPFQSASLESQKGKKGQAEPAQAVLVRERGKSIVKDLAKSPEAMKPFQSNFERDRVLRVTAQSLNRLMGLAGESLVESRWLYPFGEALQNLKKEHNKLEDSFYQLRDCLREEKLSLASNQCLLDLKQKFNEIGYQLSNRLNELDNFIRRHASLSDRLYQEVINSRMRPFADGVEAFPRMVRDLAHQLGKKVKFEIEGKSTPVDRDILEKLEAPLSHLLRNAVDHGIETPQERKTKGKPEEGMIRLDARHLGGILAITVSDDGRGIDTEQVREKIVEKNLVGKEKAAYLKSAELVDFLFSPGFSTTETTTEISGRGMGLNVVQSIIQEVGGTVRVVFTPGKGTSFHLQLPLTLSVIRALLVEISDEPYAFPLARINRVHLLEREKIELIENRPYFRYEGQNIGLVPAWQVLELSPPKTTLTELSVIVLGESMNYYGIVVDRLIGEKELVVLELDPRLGKVPDVNAGAIMEDGSPVLILDIDEIVHSIDNQLSVESLTNIENRKGTQASLSHKRVLVVDDSITVREVESRLLQNHGYEVEMAVNGVDAWNAVRIGNYDLVITDVDMPRMNGIELVRAIKNDPRFKNLPIIMVSYKEGKEDLAKGLEVGADYYLTKSNLQETTLIEAVNKLIGLRENS